MRPANDPIQKFVKRSGDFKHAPFQYSLPDTPSAIKKFQRFHHLTPDGIVGPKTNGVMRKLHTRIVERTPAPTRPLGGSLQTKVHGVYDANPKRQH